MIVAFLRLCAVVLAGALLTGCGSSVPQCAEEWIKEEAIEWYKSTADSRFHEHPRHTVIGRAPDVWNDYLNQEFRLAMVRTLDRRKGDRSWDVARRCVAELHGRDWERMYEDVHVPGGPGSRVAGYALTGEVKHLFDLHYRIFLDDDGNAHIRSWGG